jgi:hypothetical protein
MGISMLTKNKSVDAAKTAAMAQAHKSFLEKRPYETFTEDQLEAADELLKKVSHGDAMIRQTLNG